MPTLAIAGAPFEAWIHRYDPNRDSSPSAKAVAVDPRSGYVAVAGHTYAQGSNVPIYYFSVHDPFTGRELIPWPMTYSGGAGESIANAVTFDSAGNVIVTGQAQMAGDSYNYYTVKYDRFGNFDWSMPYDSNGGSDRALFVAVDAQDNVIVTGESSGAGTGTDIFTVKYDGGTGQILSSLRYSSPGNATDYPTGLAIDSTGSVIVCGVTKLSATSTDFYLGKYDMSALAGSADWERIFSSPGARDDEARDVEVDGQDNVIVAGLMRDANNNQHRFFARKYDKDGGEEWSQGFSEVPGDFKGGARSVALDAEGNVFVAGVSEVDSFDTTLLTSKLTAASGAIDWFVRGPFPANEDESVDIDDSIVKVEVDPVGNPIVCGSPKIVGSGADYFIAKYASRGEGAVLWQKVYKGAFPNEGTDRIKDMAVDPFGNVIVTGDSLREAGSKNEILTVKIGATVLATGDPLAGPGVPEGAIITQVFNPAAADTGAIAARVTAAAGKKKFGAIVTVGGKAGLRIPAIQGAAAPGIADAEFKSFSDPVMSPAGGIAFIGKISGVKSSESTGVWTNALNVDGNLELVLQQGKQVPGMDPGVTLQSVSSISLRTNHLLALIKVAGKSAGVSKANATVIYRVTSAGGLPLLRTDDEVTIDTVQAKIKSMTVFTPPKTSVGHGRYHGTSRVIAKATLDDKRTALIAVTTAGTVLPITGTGSDAGSMVTDATWDDFSLPAIDQSGFRYATLGSLTLGVADVTKANDSIIGYRFNAGSFAYVAREGDSAPGISGATFTTLSDPLVNDGGRVAFLGSVKGDNVSSKDNTGLWFGLPGAPELIARTNHPDFPATDGTGFDIDARWTSFKSIALPGAGHGPIFLATISGSGIKGSNGFGLWAVDGRGVVRKLIRSGDQLGDLTVKKFVVLQPSAGSVGATRSFSSGSTVAVLVTFSDKSTGVLNIGIP